MESLLGDLDLTGRAVVEAGCLHGVATLWMEQHGAEVWPFDIYEACREKFDEIKTAFGMRAKFHCMNLCDPHAPPEVWPADIFCLTGVYYHQQDMMLGIKQAWSGTKNVMIVEGEILVGEDECVAKFVPGAYHDNADKTCAWIPSRSCLLAMFAELPDVVRVEERPSTFPHRIAVRVWRKP
jgi:hypothetical protein